MAESPSRATSVVGAAAALLVVVAAAVLARSEGSGLLLLLAVPAVLVVLPAARRAVMGWGLFLAVLAAADLGLRFTQQDPLVVRATQVTAVVEAAYEGDPRKVADDCPRFRFRPGDAVDPGPPRDALGRMVLEVPGEDPLRILIVGDSVMQRGSAVRLRDAFAAAGQPVVIVDTSVYGYNLRDYACVLEEALPDVKPDLVILGLCVNDMPIAEVVTVDLGAGPQAYDWRSVLAEDLSLNRAPPLLLESASPWVQARRDEILARWGDKVVFDLASTDALARVAEELRTAEDVRMGALRDVDARLRGAEASVVVMLFPQVYQVRPSPLDPVLDAFLGRFDGAPYVRIDHRTTFAGFQVADIIDFEPNYGAFAAGKGMHDVIHLNAAGAAVALMEAMTAAKVPGHEGVLAQVSKKLAEEAQALLPCGGYRCEVPPGPDGSGVWKPPAACVAEGARVCRPDASAQTLGAAAPETRGAGQRSPDRAVPAACVPLVEAVGAAAGMEFIDLAGKVMQTELGMSRDDMDAFCAKHKGEPVEAQLRAITELTGLKAPARP